MNEESESSSLLHNTNIKMLELDDDSDYAFACRKNLILRGWHQWEVAMRGKGVTRRLRNPDRFLQYNAKRYSSAKGWHEERKEGKYLQGTGFSSIELVSSILLGRDGKREVQMELANEGYRT